MKKEFSPYGTFGFEKIEAPKKKTTERKSTTVKGQSDLRAPVRKK